MLALNMSGNKMAIGRSRAWTEKELSLLGTMSDREVALRIGVATPTVFLKRKSLGIPSSRPSSPLKWSAKQISLLGKHPDAEVARMLGTYRQGVIKKRHELGIPNYARESGFWHTWTTSEIALLGKMTDVALAHKIGRRNMCVTAKRRLLGIPSLIQRGPRRSNEGKVYLRKALDAWSDEETALLGKLTDREVATQLGISQAAARLKRITLGIPPCRRGKSWRVGRWTDDILARLGTEVDSDIARSIGVSSERVRQKRKELGIARFT